MSDQQNAEVQNTDSNLDQENLFGATIDAGTEEDNLKQGDQSSSTTSQVTDDSASSSEPTQSEKVEISPEAQKIIAEKAYEERKAKREVEELRQQLAEAKKQSDPGEPQLPSIPDRWDYDNEADYQAAIDEYADKKAELQAYQNQQTQLREQEDRQKQEAEQERVKALNEKVAVYSGRATELGIKPEEMQQAGQTVAAYGLKPEIVDAILADGDGPLITRYLAANPQAIDSLNQTTWLNGATVFNEVKTQATAVKPKTVSDAPQPTETLSGGATSEDDNPWGATIE